MQERVSKFKTEGLKPATVPKTATRSFKREEGYSSVQQEEASMFSVFGRWSTYFYQKVSEIEYPSGESLVKFGSSSDNMRTDNGALIEVIQFIHEHILNDAQRERDAVYSLDILLSEELPWDVDVDVIENIISLEKGEGSIEEDIRDAGLDIDDDILNDIIDYMKWSSAVLELGDMAANWLTIPWDIRRAAVVDLKDSYMRRTNEEDIIPEGTDIGKPCPWCKHTSISMNTLQTRGIDEGATDIYVCCKCKRRRYDVNLISVMNKK